MPSSTLKSHTSPKKSTLTLTKVKVWKAFIYDIAAAKFTKTEGDKTSMRKRRDTNGD